MEIIPMKEDDIEEIAVLEQSCFTVPWTKAAFKDELDNQMAAYFVAKEKEQCVGYAGFWKVAGEGHITNVAVLPQFRQKGVGSLLIEALIKQARMDSLWLLTLEVRQSNYPAQQLYKKYGFEKIGERKRYYSDTKEDAWIMTKFMEE